MSERALRLEPTGQAAPAGTFRAEPLGDGPDAGAKLTAAGGWGGVGCGLVGIAVGTAFAAFLCGGFLDGLLGLFLPVDGGAISWVIVGLGVVAALALVGYQLLLRSAVHPAEAAVSPWPLRPGEPCEIRFAQRLKRGLALRELTAELTCTESARYRVGTDTRTETRERFRTELTPVDLSPEGGGFQPARQAVTAAWEATLPADAPPSLDAQNNDVTWELSVTLVIDRHPDATTDFTLHVR